jgi:hypothetical protein
MTADEEPHMTLLDYHALRVSYAREWNRDQLEQSARAQDASLPDRLKALIPTPEERLPNDAGQIEMTSIDLKLKELCELYLKGTPEQRTFILSSIDQKLGSKLQGFGFRMATLAVRLSSEELVQLALTAHSIDDLASGDVRDELCLLAVLVDAARRVGADPVALFRKAAEDAPPASARLFRGFVRDPDQIASLGSMGFRAVEGPDGIRYRQAF